MNKILALSMAAIMCASASMAGTSVSWYFGWGMYPNGAGDLSSQTAGSGVAGSSSVLWQLVWAGADNSIDIVDPNNSANGYVSDNDVVLESRVTTAGGGTIGSDYFDEWLFCPPNTLPLAKFESSTYYNMVYIRVFQDTNPAVNEWYYDSGLITAANVDILSLHNTDTLDGNTNSGASQGDALNVQIVPEPSSMALLALGLGVVALRRKFRK